MSKRKQPNLKIISLQPLTVVLPGLPIGLNHGYMIVAYITESGNPAARNQLKPATKQWIAQTAMVIRSHANTANWQVPPKTPLRITIEYADAKVLTWDIDGRMKFLMDAIKKSIGVDDRYVVDLHPVKVRAPKDCQPWTRLTIQACGLRMVDLIDVPEEAV